jgi:hypothetical protein
MNPWLRGLDIATKVLSVGLAVIALAMLGAVVFQRARIEHIMATRPYPPPPRWRWLGVAIGAACLVAFEFIVVPHLVRPPSLRYHLLVSVVGVSMYLVLMAVFFSSAQRLQRLPLQTRIHTMYVMLAAVCVLAAASLYHVFS